MRRGRRNVDAGDALWRWASGIDEDPIPFSRFYPRSARDELQPYAGHKAYRGDNVTWLGRPERVFEVQARYAHPIDGNIFDPYKIHSVATAVRDGEVTFDVAYGQFDVVDVQTMRESIEYAADLSWGEPYTTGDEELDDYLRDPEAAIWERDTRDPGDRGYKAAVKRFERELRDAERRGAGDFGALTVQVRDGNHRVFGSIAGGERTVWVLMMENQWQDLMSNKYSTRSQRLLRKALNIRPKRRRRGRSNGPSFRVQKSPLEYPRGKAERLVLFDPAAGPAPLSDRRFADSWQMVHRSPKTGRQYKKPKRVDTPGAGDGVVAFIDFTIYPSVNKVVPYIHFMDVREDQRGQGHMRTLVAEFYRRYGPNARWIDWGDMIHPAVGKLYREYKDAEKRGGVATTGKHRYSIGSGQGRGNAKTAEFWPALHAKNKGIFYRGVGPNALSKDKYVGALGAGLYVTWDKDTARAFAGEDGTVIRYRLPVDLVLLDDMSRDMGKIKMTMGMNPWDVAAGRMFANVLRMEARALGYEGGISSDRFTGIVVFDEDRAEALDPVPKRAKKIPKRPKRPKKPKRRRLKDLPNRGRAARDRRVNKANPANDFMVAYEAFTEPHPWERGWRVWPNGIYTHLEKTAPWVLKDAINLRAIVSSDERRAGEASRVLRHITRLADRYQVKVTLSAKPFTGITDKLDQDDLVAWYKRHGWQRRRGRTFNHLIRVPDLFGDLFAED